MRGSPLVYRSLLMVVSFLLAGLLLVLAGCASLPEPPDLDQSATTRDVQVAVTERAQAYADRRGIVALGVSLVDVNEGYRYAAGFGLRDLERETPADGKTLFRVGSVSKLFTSAAVLTLVDEGRIDLDASLTRYLPDLQLVKRDVSWPDPTVRDMLTHHAGISSDRYVNWILDGQPGWERAFSDLPRAISGDYLNTEPGEVFSYSNLSYSLAGAMIDRMVEQGFYDYLREKVFEASGMEDTSYLLDETETDRLALPYRGKSEDRRFNFIRDTPAGSVYTTPEDMADFMEMILQGGTSGDVQVLSQEIVAEALTKQNAEAELDGEFSIGLTYWLMSLGPEVPQVAWHGGDLPPYHAVVMMMPETGVGVCVMTNTDAGAAALYDLAFFSIRLLAQRHLTTDIPTDPPLPPVIEPAQAELTEYEGLYAHPAGYLEVEPKNKTLELSISGSGGLHLVPREGELFTTQLRLFGFIPLNLDSLKQIQFTFDEAQGKTLIDMKQMGIPTGVGVEYTPVSPSDLWKSRTDTYQASEDAGSLMKRIRVRYERGLDALSLQPQGGLFSIGGPRMLLEPISRSEAIVAGYGRNLAQTVRFGADEKGEYLEYGGLRLYR